MFWCICCAVVAHAYGAPCAAILVLLYIWKDLMVCLVLESPRAGCAGSPSARHQSNGLICVLLPCLLHVLQSEAGAPPLFVTATGQARQGTHTDPEVGAPSQSVSAPGQAQQRSPRPVPHPSLLRQLGRPGKGLTHTDEPSANTLGMRQHVTCCDKDERRQMRQRSEATKMTCSVSKMRCVSCYST